MPAPRRAASSRLIGSAIAAVLLGATALGAAPRADTDPRAAAQVAPAEPPEAPARVLVPAEVASEAAAAPTSCASLAPAARPPKRQTPPRAPASNGGTRREATARHVEDIH